MRLISSLSSFINAWRDYPAEKNTVLGNRYIVQNMIGEGSYGLIYKCMDRKSGQIVAVKQARPSKGSYAEHLLNREAAILKSLQHSHIPAYLDLFTDHRHIYLVMSYMNGDTLEDLIFEQNQKYQEADCVSITMQLMELVLYLHKQGFVHLDLRIPNVLFKNGELNLIDFGLARRIGEPPPLRKPTRPWFRHGSKISSERHKISQESEDLQDIGHFMLFMLYSVYEPESSQSVIAERSWQEELQLSSELKMMIERLLQLRDPYSGSSEFMKELRWLVNAKNFPSK
ncbi:protein kinase [Paenibacillus sp. Cedars]|uniref:protein kinase domain-containing protein n=1 Tax=Paenibacillus sp. Cedars TaxID=1980674 RepID=UPI001161EAAF|nr:protein kinase [Paenibacillus sp. Cedars]AWP27969.1 serine/threonine protein kinase [Paenibacillus sp. Cedars]